ncbi:MAG TPA: efflux RND transporter periplasmic adaptor subunit [Candidatus Baltobacteraceae bacterium]|nr:efflux RND transporter periplasmic adaptor subunit [Candidatus Baltobacteraceae bacterium]
MIPGDPAAWHIGVPLLIAVVVIGAFALRRDRRPLTMAFVVAAALLVVAITAAQSKYASPAGDMSSMQAASGFAPIPVTTTVLRDAKDGGEVQAPGTLVPYLTQDIVARTSGLVTGLSTYTGDRVAAGQVVARLDEPELQSDANAALAAAESAQNGAVASENSASAMSADVTATRAKYTYWTRELVRERSLLEQGAVSPQEYESERAQMISAQATLDSARANASAAQAQAMAMREQVAAARSNAQSKELLAGYATVVVPSDGIVVKRLVDPGVYVAVGTPILRVATIDPLRLQAQVAQQDLNGIAVGTPFDATLDGGRIMHGRVSSISPIVDSSTHTATVEAIVRNSGDSYEPGGYARVVFHLQAPMQRGVFVVPSAAIIGGAEPGLWTIVNGAAHRRPIVVLSDDGTRARVRGSLANGMHVIVDGASNVEEDSPVTETTP